VIVEIQDWYHVTVHNDVSSVVDAMLLGRLVSAQVRTRGDDGTVQVREGVPQRPESDRHPPARTTATPLPRSAAVGG